MLVQLNAKGTRVAKLLQLLVRCPAAGRGQALAQTAPPRAASEPAAQAGQRTRHRATALRLLLLLTHRQVHAVAGGACEESHQQRKAHQSGQASTRGRLPPLGWRPPVGRVPAGVGGMAA